MKIVGRRGKDCTSKGKRRSLAGRSPVSTLDDESKRYDM